MSCVDILAFGAHPDDVEIGAGGIIAKHAYGGFKTAICNLTEAELSSNGTVENRRSESQKAASILGVEHVLNLGIPDRGIDNAHVNNLIEVIRTLRPTTVLLPYWIDRHPDHVACSKLGTEAVFDAGIAKKEIQGTSSHRVKHVFYYFLNNIAEADLIIDISGVYEKKIEALRSYTTQFDRNQGEVDTPINRSNFLEMIRGRDSMWGYQAGAYYGEALVHNMPLTREWLYPF